jgi:hypothetical protein
MEAGGEKLRAHQRKSFRSAARRVVRIAERCSPARVRFAALARALARCAPFGTIQAATGGSDGNF